MQYLTLENLGLYVLVASGVLPVLEYVARRTKTKFDDQIVGEIAGFLGFVSAYLPRVSLGKRPPAAAPAPEAK